MPVSPNLPCYMQDLDLVTDLNHVKNGVWIGSHWVLRSSSALLQCGIKHVVNTAIEFITEVPEKVNWKELEQAGISVHNTMWDDTLGEVIFPSPSIEAAVIHMDELVKAGKPVLVNCAMGRSRSASLVIAYFMARQQMSYDKALEMVKAARPQCSPNANFERQLRQLEASLQTAFSNHPNREHPQPQTPTTPSVAPPPHPNPAPIVSPPQEALFRPSPAAPQPPAAVAPVPPHTPTRPSVGPGSPKEAVTPPSPTPPSFGCSLAQQQQANVKAASSTRPGCMAPLSPLSHPPAHQSPASAPTTNTRAQHNSYGQRSSNPGLFGLSSPTSAPASAGSSGSTAAKLGQYTSPMAQRTSGLTSPRTPASAGGQHYGGGQQRNASGSTGRYGSSGYGRKGLGGAVDSWVPPECRRLSF